VHDVRSLGPLFPSARRFVGYFRFSSAAAQRRIAIHSLVRIVAAWSVERMLAIHCAH